MGERWKGRVGPVKGVDNFSNMKLAGVIGDGIHGIVFIVRTLLTRQTQHPLLALHPSPILPSLPSSIVTLSFFLSVRIIILDGDFIFFFLRSCSVSGGPH